MNVISTSYGNDSCALIQWAHETKLKHTHVVFINTGWQSHDWMERVNRLEQWAASLGFETHQLEPAVKFEQLIIGKKGFPTNQFQWCSGMLKGIPFLNWIDDLDPGCNATVLIGKRRAESRARQQTPEFIESSEYHGGRKVWHPLFSFDDNMRDDLLKSAGIDPLPYRSQECAPCVNAGRKDIKLLTEFEIKRLEDLEAVVGKNMFRPQKKMGADGIREVVRWAKSKHGKYKKDGAYDFNECSSGMCGL